MNASRTASPGEEPGLPHVQSCARTTDHGDRRLEADPCTDPTVVDAWARPADAGVAGAEPDPIRGIAGGVPRGGGPRSAGRLCVASTARLRPAAAKGGTP